MIRAPLRYSTAVRKPGGEIVVRAWDYVPLARRKKIFNLPLVRGVLSLAEMLVIGIRTLNFSADLQMEAENKKKPKGAGRKWLNSVWGTLSILIAFGLAMLIFFYFPLWAADSLNLQKTSWEFNLLTGIIRVALFLGYVWFLSLFKDLRRIYEYHGAEHMSIYAFEAGQDLTLENIRKYTTLHPRCGTSFIFLVLLLAITVYSLSDFIYYLTTGNFPGLGTRVLMHFLLLPLVAGVAFEALKLSDKTKSNFLTKIFIAPGLWLQMITTRKPSDDQIEVAVAAVQAATLSIVTPSAGNPPQAG